MNYFKYLRDYKRFKVLVIVWQKATPRQKRFFVPILESQGYVLPDGFLNPIAYYKHLSEQNKWRKVAKEKRRRAAQSFKDKFRVQFGE